MADLPRPTNEVLSVEGDARVIPGGNAQVTSFIMTPREGNENEVLQVLEETVTVSTRRRVTGGVRVGTRTDTVEATAEIDLDRYAVEITRVPVGRVVEEAPTARAVGDTTIIPVVEERLVLVKQLFLMEELHVRHVLQRETVAETVTLRRQRAVVERHGDRDQQAGGEEPGLD